MASMVLSCKTRRPSSTTANQMVAWAIRSQSEAESAKALHSLGTCLRTFLRWRDAYQAFCTQALHESQKIALKYLSLEQHHIPAESFRTLSLMTRLPEEATRRGCLPCHGRSTPPIPGSQ